MLISCDGGLTLQLALCALFHLILYIKSAQQKSQRFPLLIKLLPNHMHTH
ncbi:hypothetical protein HMPREF0880_01035 [Yokenella regensburgei ATCC 43003]|nr:hypothetical protein HMPREF0880_01035 [Yokenella regensburgei ATCC 43003]